MKVGNEALVVVRQGRGRVGLLEDSFGVQEAFGVLAVFPHSINLVLQLEHLLTCLRCQLL